MENTVEDFNPRKEISKNKIVKNIIQSCQDLFGETYLQKEILKLYNSGNQKANIDSKGNIDLEDFQRIINKISFNKIKEISNEPNGIVMNSDGRLNLVESVKQANEVGGKVPNQVVVEAVELAQREKEKEEIINKLLEDTFKIEQSNELNKITKNIFDDFEFFSNNQEFKNIMVDSDINHINKYIEKQCRDDDINEVYDNALLNSWINGKDNVHKMKAIKLYLDSQKNKNDIVSQRKLNSYLMHHPECKSIFEKNREIKKSVLQQYSKFSEGILTSKIIEYFNRDAKSDINFNELSDIDKLDYLKRTLIGLNQNETAIRKMAIVRLRTICPNLIETNKETGEITLNQEKFLDFYNGFSTLKKENDVNDLYIASIRFEEDKFVSQKLNMLEKNEDNLLIVDFSNRKESLNKIKNHLGTIELGEQTHEDNVYKKQESIDENKIGLYFEENSVEINTNNLTEEKSVKDEKDSIKSIPEVEDTLNSEKNLESKKKDRNIFNRIFTKIKTILNNNFGNSNYDNSRNKIDRRESKDVNKENIFALPKDYYPEVYEGLKRIVEEGNNKKIKNNLKSNNEGR